MAKLQSFLLVTELEFIKICYDLIVCSYLKILPISACTKIIFGHLQMTCKSSENEVSSSKNLKITVEFPLLNIEENILEPNSFLEPKISNSNKS